MSENLRDKVIQLKQRSALKAVMALLDGHLMVADQILHPASGQIARELKVRLDAREDSDATRIRSCETRSLNELDEIFSAFVATVRDCGDLLCVLPGVSIIDDSVITKFPVLRTNVAGAEQLYTFFSRRSDLDFFGVVSSDMKTFIVVSSYAAFTSDSNQFFFWTVYET
jgi:hypothetical protein